MGTSPTQNSFSMAKGFANELVRGLYHSFLPMKEKEENAIKCNKLSMSFNRMFI